MPMKPSSPSFATTSYGKVFVRSSSSATGATSCSANSRAVRRISSWSGERSKSMRRDDTERALEVLVVVRYGAGMPPTRPALRERYDRRADEVVAAAARMFAERGFHATSMADLVEATGLTAGGLYHYIGSKDELLVRICDQLMEPLLERVAAIAASDAPAEAQLRAVVREWTAHV